MEEENNFSDKDKPSTSKQAEQYESDGSADSSEVEKCPICLLAFTTDQEIGKPSVCDHIFCFPCIQEWSKVVQTCPIDRSKFDEIRVYGNLECDSLLRRVTVKEKTTLGALDYEELTACEICQNTDREDCMLLCDGCDKGFHMDCLDPPLLEIPTGNWYCDDCFESSDESEDDVEEVEDLQNDIRTRQLQPQILRTSANERIRNAVLARMTLRSTREALGEGPTIRAPTRVVKKRRATRKRKTKRRARTTVVEYDVDGSDKFAMRTRRLVKKSRKKRKLKAKPAKRRAAKAPVASSTGFKNTNHNVHDLQRGRMLAGLSNFRIFQPTNQLDYVPDEEENIEDSGIDDGAENSRGNVLTQAIIGLRNPQRRNMIIKNRVLQNCTTTSSAGNLLDSIMQDQSMFASGSIRNKFSVEKSSGKLLFLGDHEQHAKQSAGGENSDSGGEPKTENTTSDNPNTSTSENQLTPSSDPVESAGNQAEMSRSSDNRDEPLEAAGESFENTNEAPEEKKKKASKKPAIDMFDENSNPETTDSCPNFSIYDPVDGEVPAEEETSNVFQPRLRVYDEENVDLVQMSDNENQESSGEAPLAIVASQPASPDLENDKICELIPERSYTPPIAQKVTDDAPEKDDSDKKRKKEKESKRSRKRELERYNVRDRLKDRSPVKLKDKFGRNRSRSRSSPRRKHSKRRSRSASRDRVRKSRSYDRYRRSRSYSRSSRRRTPSNEYDRRKKLQKEKSSKTSRRSRARSFAPRQHRPTTPDRRARSRSKKLKKKKHRDHSKEKPSTLTKEVFTSGQNILVSVNFNNQEEKSATKRSKSQEPKEIVDITARKKINVSSKPVAIIDLARSPFRELTPEYQSNVIELSDSDGEKASEKHQAKSPDSTLSSKLYDPFDILNSPSNENVTSSQNAAVQKLPEKPQEPVKNVMHYNKNVMAMASNSGLFFNEENLVTSSSSMATNEKQLPLLFTPMKGDAVANEKNASKNETVPMDLAESPYSPHEYDDSFAPHEENTAKSPRTKQSKGGNKAENIFDVLFGTSTPPGLDRVKSSNKKGTSGEKPVDSNRHLMKMKRQERVIEEVKLVIKPYYSKRTITKEQYKEILRKAVPKICHSREINPQKIKVLIDSYVKLFKHRKKHSSTDEIL